MGTLALGEAGIGEDYNSPPDFKNQMRAEMKAFVSCVRGTAQQAGAQLTDIMLAQDFHDLTGQVIAKVVTLAATIEEQLVALLIQTAPPETSAKAAPCCRAFGGWADNRPHGNLSHDQGQWQPYRSKSCRLWCCQSVSPTR